jgi:excisionase family DNA binding protein
VENHDQKGLTLLWGARSIAAALNISERKCFHLLENGELPAKKIGGSWVLPREAISQIFDNSSAAA